MALKKPLNPFYPLLVIAGTAFCLTACAYGMMAMRELRPEHVAGMPNAADGTANPKASERPHPLAGLLSGSGERLLLGELALLAVFSFLAMGTDGYWTRRAEAAAARAKAAAPEKPTGSST
jgi:hypothetical protein